MYFQANGEMTLDYIHVKPQSKQMNPPFVPLPKLYTVYLSDNQCTYSKCTHAVDLGA